MKKTFGTGFNGIELKFVKNDLYIGIYWKKDQLCCRDYLFHIYICLIPMIPLHIYFEKARKNSECWIHNKKKLEKINKKIKGKIK